MSFFGLSEYVKNVEKDLNNFIKGVDLLHDSLLPSECTTLYDDEENVLL